ncbi:hypothetical protein TNCV_2408781 [Trichonephila clavipes]|nr:hypothetical protein TNCV_2408781 [Trichonephila clavipes]
MRFFKITVPNVVGYLKDTCQFVIPNFRSPLKVFPTDVHVGGSTFHYVRTRRCTRVTDLNSVNQSTHHTFCCGVHTFTNEASVTGISSTIPEK